MMDWRALWDAATTTALGLGSILLRILLIVVPLLAASEVIRTRQWYQRFLHRAAPSFRKLGFGPESLMSLFTGLAFGISYGAGVLIAQSRSGELPRQQAFLVALFLGVCHALPEDTLLFVAVGANGWVPIIARLTTALSIVPAIAYLGRRRQRQQSSPSISE